MAKPDFTITEIAQMLALRVAREAGQRLTGQVRFVLHMRDGGVGRVECEVKEDMALPGRTPNQG